MTEEEAAIYLPLLDGQSVREAYEEHLFTAKQFFLSRFPISKVFNGRMEKLRRIHEAYLFFGGQSQVFESIFVPFDVKSSSVMATFNAYNLTRNKLKIELNRSLCVLQLEGVLNQMFKITKEYAILWQMEKGNFNNVIIGKEPDPMEILSALHEAGGARDLTFGDLSGLDEENPLKREAKRLSLWLKMENNE